MTNELQIFNFNNHQIRTVLLNGEPWFVARDVCKGLEIKNTTQAIHKLDEDERSMLNIGRQGKANIINEPGVYGLVWTSNKEEAKEFKRWLKHEVLPSIRKTGSYSVDKPVLVSEHTRALPAGKKEIVLSEKAREEIGGITKAVVGKALEGCKVIEYVNPIKNILSDDLLTESGLTPMEIETHLSHLLTGLWDYKKSSADMYKLYRLLEACKGLACRYYSYASHLQGHVDFCEHYRGKNTKYFEMNTDALYATVRGMLDTRIELSAL